MRLAILALGLCLVACGGGETRPDRDSGTASNQGGSGGQAGAAGRGSGGESGHIGATGGSTGSGLETCDALCAWEVGVSGDCPDAALEQCQASFDVGVMSVDAPCENTLSIWCKCLLDHTDPNVVSCGEGPVTSNIPVINGSPEACNDETEAWSACLTN